MTKPDPIADYLVNLDQLLAEGKIDQSNYDLNKARALANATRNPAGSFWHTLGIVALVLVGVLILGWLLSALGAH
jgi:cytochrome c-type biogenesis protein CcmH/NrfG